MSTSRASPAPPVAPRPDQPSEIRRDFPVSTPEFTAPVRLFEFGVPENVRNRVPHAHRRVKFAYWVPNVSGGLVIVAYKKLGVDLLLLGFVHYHEEAEFFGRRVLPLVRELEAQLPRVRPRPGLRRQPA
jgi:hypothetical protein